MVAIVFAHPEFLALLLALPLLIVTHIYLFRFTKRKAMLFSNLETLRRVTGKRVLTRNIGVLALRLLAIACVVLAVSQPTLRYEGEEHAADIVLAIDTSASMTAEDLTPTRFEAAKRAANALLDGLNATARIGLVGFSGIVTVEQLPTSDRALVRSALDGMRIETISGTNLPEAIITGTNLLLPSARGRVLFLFTDGSTTVGSFRNDPVARSVSYAREHGVTVHAVAMGRPDFTPTGYLPRLYNVSAAYDEETLGFIANATGGTLLYAYTDAELEDSYTQLLSGTRTALQERDFAFGLLLVALALLFVEWGMTNTRFRLIP